MSYAIFKLAKDVLLALVSAIVSVIYFIATQDESLFMAIFFGIVLAGVPFGWRILSKFISAMSVAGFFIKLIGAIIVGWIALPITLIKDVVVLIIAIVSSNGNECEELA